MVDYYEFLQISPNADADTIHRVFRFLAARLHPDNPESGDAEMFHLLKVAYDVLSNPTARADYDAQRKAEPESQNPFSEQVDFMDSLDGELNRRLAVLAVLYYRRRTNPHMPEVSLGEIETRMGFPRDYLDFTIWYLNKKGYVTKGDNAQLALTADGVDFIESQRGNLPVLNKLLTSGTGQPTVEGAKSNRQQQSQQPAPPKGSVPSKGSAARNERRSNDERRNAPDRRVGLPDLRVAKIERRKPASDRRTEKKERRHFDAGGRRGGD
ncbi:MAG: J domain-containing protein [Terracidiphilus sp.]